MGAAKHLFSFVGVLAIRNTVGLYVHSYLNNIYQVIVMYKAYKYKSYIQNIASVKKYFSLLKIATVTVMI